MPWGAAAGRENQWSLEAACSGDDPHSTQPRVGVPEASRQRALLSLSSQGLLSAWWSYPLLSVHSSFLSVTGPAMCLSHRGQAWNLCGPAWTLALSSISWISLWAPSIISIAWLRPWVLSPGSVFEPHPWAHPLGSISIFCPWVPPPDFVPGLYHRTFSLGSILGLINLVSVPCLYPWVPFLGFITWLYPELHSWAPSPAPNHHHHPHSDHAWLISIRSSPRACIWETYGHSPVMEGRVGSGVVVFTFATNHR